MYDVVIIGAGIAGLSAGIYARRGNLNVKILEANAFGGQIVNSSNVENYPGFVCIKGFDLAKNFYDQAKSLGCEISYEKVVKIDDNKVITNKNIYEARCIIIASGLRVKKLGVNGEDELVGKGVSYCATCDGNFYKNKKVLVVGGGNTALEDALFLSNIASKVYIMIRRNVFRGDKVLVNKVLNTENIEVKTEANVTEINGSDFLEKVTYRQDGIEKQLDVDGLFVAIGYTPDSEYLKDVVDLNDDGFVVSETCETNKDYIFVAGDVRTKNLRQVVTAASDGAIAASRAIQFLCRNK